METALFESQDEHLSPVQEKLVSQQGEFMDIVGEVSAEKNQFVQEMVDVGYTTKISSRKKDEIKDPTFENGEKDEKEDIFSTLTVEDVDKILNH